MPSPNIFISAASQDLKSFRDSVAHSIDRVGEFKAIVQDWSLGTTPKNITELLRGCISRCDALIHVAGIAYGSEPDLPPYPEFRCSYTQMEFYEAKRRGKLVYTIICGTDFPYDSFTAEDVSLRTLQEAHRRRLLSGDFTSTPIAHLASAGKPFRAHVESSHEFGLEIMKILFSVTREFSPSFVGCSNWDERIRSLFENLFKDGHTSSTPSLTTQQLRRRIAETQIAALDLEDQLTDWSDERFSSLEAQVEDQSRRGKVREMASALAKHAKAKTVLLLGDPGSGKSVALRHYCRLALQKTLSASSLRAPVPIYVNLRETQFPVSWAKGALPAVQDIVDALRSFILHRITTYLPAHERKSLSLQLEALLASSDAILVLDSFDELAPLLDADERDARLENFSAALHILFAHQFRRGIVASRHYRSPINPFKPGITLVIRPLSDALLFELICKRCGELSTNLVERLFRERPDLVSVARNPFIATLLIRYLLNAPVPNRPLLPADQAAIFASFVEGYLVETCLRIESSLQSTSILRSAEALARRVFETSNLELSVADLPPELRQGELAIALQTLIKVRFLRVGDPETGLISFAHRRFAEYFATRDQIARGLTLSSESIALDSKWRDALVLYCQLANDQESIAVAEKCWEKIAAGLTPDPISTSEERYQAQLHLRFLLEAFRHRPVLLATHRHVLSDYIRSSLEQPPKTDSFDLLGAKQAVEAIALCDEEQVGELLAMALARKDPWITETALRACRYVITESPRLLSQLMKHVSTLQSAEVMSQKNEFKVLFGLSRTTEGIISYIRLRILQTRLRFIGTALILALPAWFAFTGRFHLLYQPQTYLLPFIALSLVINYVIPRLVPSVRERTNGNVVELGLSAILMAMGIFAALAWLKDPEVRETATAMLGAGIYRGEFAIGSLLLPLFFPYSIVHVYWRATHIWIPLLRLARTKLFFWGTVSALALVFLATIFLASVAKDWMDSIVAFYFICLFCLISIAIIILPFFALDAVLKYRRMSRQLSRRLTRGQIAEQMRGAGKNSFARWLYIRRLAAEPREVTGEWPGGRQPYFRRESSSSTLGRLDEEWRDADRITTRDTG